MSLALNQGQSTPVHLLTNLPLPLVLAASVTLTALGIITPTLQANLITNGTFENPLLSGNQEVALTAGTTSLPSWTVTGAVGLYSSAYAAQYTGGVNATQLVDLTGNTSSGGTISQSIATVAGASYRLTLDNYNYGQMNASTIPGGKAFSIQALSGSNTAGSYFTPYRTLTTVTYDFVATGSSTTLAIKDQSGGFDSNAAWIDNVTINLVPEFSHWSLFAGFGLLVFGSPTWRRAWRLTRRQGESGSE